MASLPSVAIPLSSAYCVPPCSSKGSPTAKPCKKTGLPVNRKQEDPYYLIDTMNI